MSGLRAGAEEYVAMRRALGRKPFLRSTGRYLTREGAHDRGRLR